MVRAATEHENVIGDPEPMVYAKGFDEGTTVLEPWCWTADTSITIRMKSELTLDLVRRFREAILKMAVPRRMLRWDAEPGERGGALAEPDDGG
jgi:small-conductance mechanosensitive channel